MELRMTALQKGKGRRHGTAHDDATKHIAAQTHFLDTGGIR
jgi:hypothetical protein